MEPYTWQQQGENEWVFGYLIRGIIWVSVAEVYFDKDQDGPEGGWVWFVKGGSRGKSPSLGHAIVDAEHALGIE